ncbi:MAG: hypothetical protein IKZ49_04390 [Alphaproteobacteria bacterium]|nr:hypothetical protein [Alphaproteobacteria bacterium]
MSDGLIPVFQNESQPELSIKERFKMAFVYPFSKKIFYKQWENTPVSMRFRLTNKCNEICPRCFECSGPNNPANNIPVEDVAFYGNVDNMHYFDTFMTGGEWSLIYDKEPHYLLKIFNKLDLSKSSNYIIQTNARWVDGPNAKQILDDLKKIQLKLGKSGKILKLDTSVDRYRSQKSIDGVIKLIRTIVLDPEFKNTKIRIASCALDAGMANKKVLRPEFFEPYGIKLRFENRSLHNMYFQVCYANDRRIVIHEESPTMMVGRAKENGIGYKIYYPQMQCEGLQNGYEYMELALREDGMIKWHNWYDWNIMVPYKDKNNQNKPLEQIKKELVDMAWKRAIKSNIKDTLINFIPIYGQIRTIYRTNQMKKTFDENRKKFVIKAQRVNCI